MATMKNCFIGRYCAMCDNYTYSAIDHDFSVGCGQCDFYTGCNDCMKYSYCERDDKGIDNQRICKIVGERSDRQNPAL